MVPLPDRAAILSGSERFPGIYIRQGESHRRKPRRQRDPPESSPGGAQNATGFSTKFARGQALPRPRDPATTPNPATARGASLPPRPTPAQHRPLQRPRAGAPSRASFRPLSLGPSVGPPLALGRSHRRFNGKRKSRGRRSGGRGAAVEEGEGDPPRSHVVRTPVNRARRRVSQRNTKAAGKRRQGEFPAPGGAPQRPAAAMGLRRPEPGSRQAAGPASPPGPGRRGSA